MMHTDFEIETALLTGSLATFCLKVPVDIGDCAQGNSKTPAIPAQAGMTAFLEAGFVKKPRSSDSVQTNRATFGEICWLCRRQRRCRFD